MVEFSDRLKELRNKHGLSTRDIAGLLGVSIRNIQHYETGRHKPNIDAIIKLADYFGVTVDYLIGRTDTR
jgi:transcriptional regulator with XRE-family HTH domain